MNKKLAVNTVSSFAFRICTILCGFILPKLILSSYGSEINGLVNSITQFLAILSFLELGVGAVIQSALYKPLADGDNAQISRIMVSGQKFFSKIAFILVVYVLLLFFLYPCIADQDLGFIFTGSLVLIIGVSSFAQYYFGISNSLLLTADQRGYISYNAQTITLILNTISCFILIKFGASIHLVKLVTSLIYIARPILLSAYVRKNYEIDWKITYKEEPIKQKWNGVAQHIAAVVLDHTDNIVLTMFAGLKAVSVYSVYYMIVSGVKQLLLETKNGIQSLIGELWAKQELDELKRVFGWTEWAIHTGTVFLFAVTAVLILPFVKLYTAEVNDANYIQPLFAILITAANAGHCLRLPYSIMILAGGHYKQTQSNYIVAAVVNVVISVSTVHVWGLVGVAVGTLVAMLYQTVWMAAYNSKNFIYWSMRSFAKQIVVDAISVLCISIISIVFKVNVVTWVGWIAYAVIVSVVTVVIQLVINILFYRDHVKRLVKSAGRWISRRRHG